MPDDEKLVSKIDTFPTSRSFSHAFGYRRVALYCRVSTKMERQLDSLSAQMDFEKQDILDHPLWEYVETYTDIGSGRSFKARPGFKRMMADCEAGKIDLIYTKSISRFGRNCVDFLMTLRRLKELKVDVYFQNEDILLLSEEGEFLLTLHAALAQAKSEEKSTNIRWGIKRSAMHPDSHPVLPRTCFGYGRDGNRHLVIDDREAAVVRRIFGWYAQGWSIVRIKMELETSRIPSPRGKRRWALRTIGDMLSNEKYAGDSVYAQTVAAEYPGIRRVRNSPDKILRSENHHAAIIDKAFFDRIREMRSLRSNVEVNELGNRVMKSSHYSMKLPRDTVGAPTDPIHD